jgi:anion-transporting  ArsA/GET3 family ATPase
MADLFDKRFIVNTGKGGVGKSTASLAMALAFAKRNKRVLIMQMNVPDRFGPLFGKEPVGSEIVELTRNIHCVNPTPADAMQEYVLMFIKFKTVYKKVFENRIVSRFLRMMPGLPELVMLGKAYYHEKEEENGRPRWDAVILDAPATGHGMFLLQIPRVIDESLSSGMMVDEAKRMLDLLADRKRAVLNIVTLAEEMPVNESIELYENIQKELDIDIGYIIANHLYSERFSSAEANAMNELHDASDPTSEIAEMLAAGRFRHSRRQLQAEYLHQLRRELEPPTLELPFLFARELKVEQYETLADSLQRSIEIEGRR